jgi:hypothetical protein
LIEEHLNGKQSPGGVFPDDRAVFIQEEVEPVGCAAGAVGAEAGNDASVLVADERIRSVDRRAELALALGGIAGNADDLDSEFLELGVPFTELGEFLRSSRCECCREERQQDLRPTRDVFKAEVRSRSAQRRRRVLAWGLELSQRHPSEHDHRQREPCQSSHNLNLLAVIRNTSHECISRAAR